MEYFYTGCQKIISFDSTEIIGKIEKKRYISYNLSYFRYIKVRNIDPC